MTDFDDLDTINYTTSIVTKVATFKMVVTTIL